MVSNKRTTKWSRANFICFDGEGFDVNGQHEYTYLAAYDGAEYWHVRDDEGLDTRTCFDFLTSIASYHKTGICVIFGGSYDANMMMRDIDRRCLERIHNTGKTNWNGYYIKYAPRKYLSITNRRTGKTCMLWDVIGFFQTSFQNALTEWLNVSDETIAKGKESRGNFTAANMDFIMAYCNTELQYFMDLMHALYTALKNAGFVLRRWDGSGAIASYLFTYHQMHLYKGTDEEQAEHYDKARSAYAGGRFELFQPGDWQQPVYNYDINSAYPYAICLLPTFTKLVKVTDISDYKPTDYDLCYVKYNNTEAVKADTMNHSLGDKNHPGTIHPFFWRGSQQQISFPHEREGWVWGVELNAALKHRHFANAIEVTEVWHWPDNGERPWRWVAELYDKRAELKRQGNSAQKAMKLGLNSLYGKMAQQKGWHAGEPIPRTHQLYWAGWVTAKTRAMLFTAMMQKPFAIIACETDGLYSSEPLDLEVGPKLGRWEETVYQSLTYVQSGMYFATTLEGKEISKYRGLDKNTLTREMVIDAYERFRKAFKKNYKRYLRVSALSTRFRTLGTSLVGERLSEWRSWQQEEKQVDLVGHGSKRTVWLTTRTKYGAGIHHTTIACTAGTYPETISQPYNVLWIDADEKLAMYADQEAAMEGILIDV